MHKPSKRWVWTSFLCLFAGSYVLVFVGNFLLGVFLDRKPPHATTLLLLGLFAACWYVFPRFVAERRTNQALSAPDAQQVLADDERAPIVYLRSFHDEKKVLKKYRKSFPTEEEQLATVIRRLGPFVAIGDPTEALPTVGAARMYIRNGDWQGKVRSLIEHAAFVVIRLGDSPGVLWELTQSLAALSLKRIVLINALNRTAYESAGLEMKKLGILLPAFRRRPSLIYFDNGRAVRVELDTAHLRGPYSSTRLEICLAIALAPFLRRLGLDSAIPPVNPWKRAQMACMLFGVIVLFLVFSSGFVLFTAELGRVTRVTTAHVLLIVFNGLAAISMGALALAWARCLLLQPRAAGLGTAGDEAP